ncbi:MAG: peptide deformylase [Pseudomonadota bacterium]
MALRTILLAPHPVLKRPAKPVSSVSADIKTLLEDMLETMYAAPGIGLAGPQVGVSERVVVIDAAGKDEPPDPMRMVNPEIIWTSEETHTLEEGCLSLPDQWGDVTRHVAVKAAWLDENGIRREREATGLLAACLQHEIDHLDGILFVDHMSALKRNMIMRKLSKWKKAKAKEDA